MLFYKEKFHQLREQRGLTLKNIALVCGVAEATVQKWEKKPNFQPRPAKIPVLAKLLHCAESDLAQYGGNLEKVVDEIRESGEQCNAMLFGANVALEHDRIELAVHHNAELAPNDPTREEQLAENNREIYDNLCLMFQKIAKHLRVTDLTGAPAASSSIPGLSEEEQLLIDYFRALSVKGKFEAMAAIGALRAKEPAPSASANIA